MRTLVVCILVACGSGSQPPAKPIVVAPPPVDAAVVLPDPTPPDLRLPSTVRPLRHDVVLTLDPAAEDFRGTITIEIDVKEATSVLWLHGEEIKLERVALASGSRMFEARPIYPTKDLIGLVLATQLPRGHAKLTMEYTGKIHRNDGSGIYTAQETGDWYLYTQFEATDAREAFPCFDEPSFKAPWKIAIETKKELAVFGNTPITGEKDLGNGRKLVELAETKPLPSYLVAFAVGPFETVDAGKTRGGAPIRIVVPKGRTGDVAYPVATTKTLVELMEDYFGSPYPYEKLDMLACAVFNAGAMENPGLVTWRQELLLTKPADATLDRQQTYAIVAAHEIAHMWFGNFVTLAWWDDIWLNEAFATWMEAKIIDQWKPAWDGKIEAAASKSGVMGSDSLDTARAVRQPIDSSGDIQNAFDGITYRKGQSVISMVEAYIGPDAFKAGVRAYLSKHAWGNATYDDFVDAIAKADLENSRGDRYQVARALFTKPIFDSFIKQSGVPLVEVDLQCKPGGSPMLAFSQRRYAPTGSQIDPKRTWTIPICVRWGVGAKTGRDCTTLSRETMNFSLSARSCPDWLHPNEGSIGYYRMQPKGKPFDNLLAKAPKVLTLPERIGLLGDVNALVASGAVGNGVALGLVASLSKDKNRHIVDASIGVVAGIEDMVPDNLLPNYQRLIKKLYGARAAELGWKSKPGEDDNTKKLRPSLLALVAVDGRDAKMIATATDLAWKWLADHKAVEPELVGTVLRIAAKFGDQKLFDRIHADAKAAKDRTERGRLLGAMGAFTDPKIVEQAMAISLTNEFELREALSLLQGGFTDRKTRTFAFEFVKKNFDAIAAKLPEPFRPYMAFTFVPLCDESKKADIVAFFKPRMEKIEGGARMMAQALESFTLCVAAKKAQTPGVVTFLKRQ